METCGMDKEIVVLSHMQCYIKIKMNKLELRNYMEESYKYKMKRKKQDTK